MIRAVGERILVRIVEKEKPKGILIMPNEKEEYQVGLVLSIGEDVWLYPEKSQPVKIGDYVWSRKYAGLLVEFDGEQLISLEWKEILAACEEYK